MTLEQHPISDQRIIDYLHANYGIEVIALTFLSLGADMNASVYTAKAQDHFSS